MIWFLIPLPTGRTHARCRLCGDEGTHMNDRAAELWVRYHDPVQCGRRARVQKAAQALTTAPRSDEGPHETPTPIHHHPAALTGAVTTSEEIAS